MLNIWLPSKINATLKYLDPYQVSETRDYFGLFFLIDFRLQSTGTIFYGAIHNKWQKNETVCLAIL
jgi:hypothetical protein